MSKLGNFIDTLSDTQRDRIVEATEWGCSGNRVGEFQNFDGLVFGCILEHVHGSDEAAGEPGVFLQIGTYYDRLCIRFGLDRMVRIIKARAARANNRAVREMLRQAVAS